MTAAELLRGLAREPITTFDADVVDRLLPLLAGLVEVAARVIGPSGTTGAGRPGMWVDRTFIRLDRAPSLVALRDAVAALEAAAAKEVK